MALLRHRRNLGSALTCNVQLIRCLDHAIEERIAVQKAALYHPLGQPVEITQHRATLGFEDLGLVPESLLHVRKEGVSCVDSGASAARFGAASETPRVTQLDADARLEQLTFERFRTAQTSL